MQKSAKQRTDNIKSEDIKIIVNESGKSTFAVDFSYDYSQNIYYKSKDGEGYTITITEAKDLGSRDISTTKKERVYSIKGTISLVKLYQAVGFNDPLSNAASIELKDVEFIHEITSIPTIK